MLVTPTYLKHFDGTPSLAAMNTFHTWTAPTAPLQSSPWIFIRKQVQKLFHLITPRHFAPVQNHWPVYSLFITTIQISFFCDLLCDATFQTWRLKSSSDCTWRYFLIRPFQNKNFEYSLRKLTFRIHCKHTIFT